MFSWDDLKHFLAFARTGSIVAAARAQGVNHSTVQRRLAELEKRLGQKLIERDLNGYRLSKLGEELLPHAERIEEAVAAFGRQIAASGNKRPTGTIRVTCSSTVGLRLKRTALIDAFEASFPGLRVELVISDRILDLSKGEADIAIRSKGGEPEDEALVGRKITDQVWAVYASREYVESHGRPERPEDIGRHRVVQCNGAIANLAAARWLRRVAPHAIVAAYSESWSGVLLAVKSGAGVSPLPRVHGDSESELVRVIDDLPDLVTHFHLLAHRDLYRAPRVRAFFDFVQSEIKTFRAVLSGQAVASEKNAPAMSTMG
jgi:DNA-binding transcriptional LysR family regulator